MTTDILIVGAGKSKEPTGLRRTRLLLRSPQAFIAVGILVLVVLVSFIGPLFIGDRANVQDLTLRLVPPFQGGDAANLLGTDGLGRSMLMQLVVGTRTSLIIAALSVGFAALIGATIGLCAGYFGGWFDTIIMRISDVVLTLPSLMLALVIMYILGPSVVNLIVVLAITRIPVYMRTARAQTLSARERVFVESARAIGSTSARIIGRDIRPTVIPTILTLAMLEVARMILAAAGLSFIGVGLQRPDVDLGMMVSDGRAYLSSAWWVTVFPGIVIVVISLAANVLSNWLRAIEDPSQSAMFIKPLKEKRTARSRRVHAEKIVDTLDRDDAAALPKETKR